ncbi:MAG: 4Fe-4S dicluster domain-containing protein [Candidatus Cloacimonadota bacterium]|nr:MAG: 4Fe-4S dicluster domain-containing protein [Candidatus Cloacimonadota bacterium]
MPFRADVLICMGTSCIENNSFEIRELIQEEIKKHNLEEEIRLVSTGCFGFCDAGPIILVQPDGVFYQRVTEKDIPFLVEEHFLKGRPVKKLMYTPPKEKVPIPKLAEIPFFNQQILIALRNRGLIDPEKIDEYIARDGYAALAKVISSMTAQQVIEEVKASGLRGRGGGGFPTGIKWELCRHAGEERNEVRYVICNADEGDPGAFMDRSIIESDPHSIIEGMIIGAYAIGSHQGYVYIRKEYPIALDRLNTGLEQAREYGLLGDDIFGSGFDFDIEVHRGAGAFVCGESTALMASLEGKAGVPRAKYIHTVEYGLWNKPSCLNNVETWVNIPVIINRGAKWFTRIGTGDVSESPWGGSKGTKVFSLTGKINNTGLVEVPMGITLREIIFNIGGGIKKDKKFKMVQTGGPSGGFLPEELLNLPVDFDSLTKAGSMMGSGGMVVGDEDTCMIDMAKYFVSFLVTESCGKCVPCREGLKRMKEILERISEGEGKEEDIELLEELGFILENGALCGLGKSAANPVLTSIKYFRDEYEVHIREKKCPAGVCKELIEYGIDQEKCNGCTLCARKCPTDAISGEQKQVHTIDTSKCIKCGICYEVCRFDAVYRK